MNKTCNKCGVAKDLSEFSTTSFYKGAVQHRGDCKKCNAKAANEKYHQNSEKFRAATKKWRAQNPDKVRNNHIWNMYRLRPEDLEAILESQNNECPICSKKLDVPHIDHCHETGKVRGVLCITCNTGLGKFQDSVEQLQKAIQYLQKPSE